MQVLMPTVTEPGGAAVVTAWFVDDGDTVERGQLIAEVQAEKVSQDVEAPVDGTIDGCVPINEPVAQGDPICSLVSDGSATRGGGTAAAAAKPSPPGERPPSSPAARRLARELGIELSAVVGTGPGGRITEQDVLGGVRTPEDVIPAVGTPMIGLRAVVAANMRRSHRETAPVTLTTSARLPDDASTRITARVVRAALHGLTRHPHLDGTRDGDRYVPAVVTSIAVAIQTDAGLVAPVLGDLTGSSTDEIADRIDSLAVSARHGSLEAADFDGGTFTISNLGAQGIEWFTPIINLPQIAILGVGAFAVVPRFDDDGVVVPSRLLPLSLTFDHAFVDGAPAAAFLASVVGALEHPED
jgi:pyruvate/2-oxoglutarate dehydrogenase complex dihydrolipoamide acyltransferase (E2) component